MRTSRPEPHTLAGAYVLDALTSADRVRLERHLARCNACAREVSGLWEAAARLAAAAAAEPPEGLIERALAVAARTRQLPPVTRETTPPRPDRHAGAARSSGPAGGGRAVRLVRRARMPRVAVALAAAFMIASGVLGLAARTAARELEQNQLRGHAIAAIMTAHDATILTAQLSGGGTATVVMSPRERALVLAVAGLRALPASRCYEVWLMGPRGDTPAGMLPSPRQGMAGPVTASGLNPGDRLGLTVEPAGGSLHPTSAMIFVLAL
jgi:anti-sigma-K factor RskA